MLAIKSTIKAIPAKPLNDGSVSSKGQPMTAATNSDSIIDNDMSEEMVIILVKSLNWQMRKNALSLIRNSAQKLRIEQSNRM